MAWTQGLNMRVGARWCARGVLALSIGQVGQAGAHAPRSETPEVVTVGVFAMAPYVTMGADVPRGILIDFFDHEIAPRMGVRFRWERPMTMARLENSLASGRVMFTPILARTASRERARIRFVGSAHIRLDPCLAVLPDSALTDVATPADLADLTVGWVQAGALPPFMLDKRIRLDRVGSVDWTNANLEKLKLGRIDAAYFSNPYTPRFFSARTGTPIRLISMPVKGPSLYGAFSPLASRELQGRYARAAEEAFAHDRFSGYLHKAVLAQVLATPVRDETR